jgi:hypothetical protein
MVMTENNDLFDLHLLSNPTDDWKASDS